MRPFILASWASELAGASLEDPAARSACKEVAEASTLVVPACEICRIFTSLAASAQGMAQLQQHFSSYTDMQAAVLAHRQASGPQTAWTANPDRW